MSMWKWKKIQEMSRGLTMEIKTDQLASSLSVGVTTALTFDDILLVPRHSQILPSEVNISSQITRNISLNVPLASAAMDTVTEANMAIAMAQIGGIGIIHKNLEISAQASEVDRVKRSESGMILDPITLGVEATVGDAFELMRENKIGGITFVANFPNG